MSESNRGNLGILGKGAKLVSLMHEVIQINMSGAGLRYLYKFDLKKTTTTKKKNIVTL